MFTLCRVAPLLAVLAGAAPAIEVGRYAVFETDFNASGSYGNPYVQVSGEAAVTRPDGTAWTVPVFWDGGQTWKLRISPDALGKWTYRVSSNDAGLNGKSGDFVCVESNRPGGLRASRRSNSHFERQNGSPVWFMGDTAWAYFTDIAEEKHDRAQAEAYAKLRASQGFNVIHSMLLSEGGDGNQNGPPWRALAEEQLNPGYFQEVDSRVDFANKQGLTVGIAIAWGDKRKQEPFAWRRFPSLEARKRYARYIAARYAAYDTYFLVSGEWHGEVRTRGNVTDEQMYREFVEIGAAFASAEPHKRLLGIHPMTSHGSVREFKAAPWMSFGDYQQNYQRLHERILLSRRSPGPVVNSEYGYFLRDQNGDGKPDKSNSYSADDMRHASWDIVTAGGYLVTGFGTTYFGGRRDPGTFDLQASKNRVWEAQMSNIKKLFAALDWWSLHPADELLTSSAARSGDNRGAATAVERGGELRPPKVAYWAMADPGRTYVLYVRGTTEPVLLDLGARPRKFRVRQYDPRSGEFGSSSETVVKDTFTFKPTDSADWIVLLEAVD